jgi:hypothetical protein
VNSARGRSAHSVVESLVTSFSVKLYRRRERSFGWGEFTGLPPGKRVLPRDCCEQLEENSERWPRPLQGFIVGLVMAGYQDARRLRFIREAAELRARRGGSKVRYETAAPNLVIRLRSSHCAISLPVVVTQGDIHKHVAEGSLETDHQRFGVFTALIAFVGREQ